MDEASFPPWLDLPDELTLLVFAHLDLRDLLTASAVCKQWWRVSTDPVVWRSLYTGTFGPPATYAPDRRGGVRLGDGTDGNIPTGPVTNRGSRGRSTSCGRGSNNTGGSGGGSRLGSSLGVDGTTGPPPAAATEASHRSTTTYSALKKRHGSQRHRQAVADEAAVLRGPLGNAEWRSRYFMRAIVEDDVALMDRVLAFIALRTELWGYDVRAQRIDLKLPDVADGETKLKIREPFYVFDGRLLRNEADIYTDFDVRARNITATVAAELVDPQALRKLEAALHVMFAPGVDPPTPLARVVEDDFVVGGEAGAGVGAEGGDGGVPSGTNRRNGGGVVGNVYGLDDLRDGGVLGGAEAANNGEYNNPNPNATGINNNFNGGDGGDGGGESGDDGEFDGDGDGDGDADEDEEGPFGRGSRLRMELFPVSPRELRVLITSHFNSNADIVLLTELLNTGGRPRGSAPPSPAQSSSQPSPSQPSPSQLSPRQLSPGQPFTTPERQGFGPGSPPSNRVVNEGGVVSPFVESAVARPGLHSQQCTDSADTTHASTSGSPSSLGLGTASATSTGPTTAYPLPATAYPMPVTAHPMPATAQSTPAAVQPEPQTAGPTTAKPVSMSLATSATAEATVEATSAEATTVAAATTASEVDDSKPLDSQTVYEIYYQDGEEVSQQQLAADSVYAEWERDARRKKKKKKKGGGGGSAKNSGNTSNRTNNSNGSTFTEAGLQSGSPPRKSPHTSPYTSPYASPYLEGGTASPDLPAGVASPEYSPTGGVLRSANSTPVQPVNQRRGGSGDQSPYAGSLAVGAGGSGTATTSSKKKKRKARRQRALSYDESESKATWFYGILREDESGAVYHSFVGFDDHVAVAVTNMYSTWESE